MKNIIVTVIDEAGTCACDLELPVDLAEETLLTGVIDTIKHANLSLNLGQEYRIYMNRLQRFLNSGETLYEAGVRNGDYLTISNRI